MGKKDRLLGKLQSLSPNFTWDELVSVLASFGYKVHTGKRGSARRFVGPNGEVIRLHEPHPGNIVLKPYLKQVVAHLEDKGHI